jgi:isoleucyl-tRNA synthetase
MSKSLGNVIGPEKVIKQFGADVLRLWIASVEYNEDVRFSDTILQRLTEAYKKFRNTFRYALSVLGDFDPAKDAIAPADMLAVDQWILFEADELVRKCRGYYDEYAFHKVYRAVYDFTTIIFSAVYVDVSKDRLYTALPTSRARRSAQTAMYRIGHALVRLLAPLLAFTTEEVWSYLPKTEGEPDSVHVALFPEPGEITAGLPADALARRPEWVQLMDVRREVLAALELARQKKEIGSGLEAKVTLSASGAVADLLQLHRADLPDLFIVSQVEIAPGGETLSVAVERAEGAKCDRCWKYTTDVGSRPDIHPSICAECADEVQRFVS